MKNIEIFMAEGKPMVSSRLIAEHFGKQHKHVLDAIREVMANAPESFNGPNFRPVEYLDAKGEKRPAYDLTRDAFTLVVMGFTGPEAMAWKIRYIEAFNAMESKLLESLRDEKFQAKIQLYLTEEMRPWQKTFPDELWAEFSRLTGHIIEGSQRPQYWGKLVNEFIYGYLDQDVKNWLRDNAPKSAHGKRYHQFFNEQFGLKKLTEHMWLVIGTARSSFSVADLRNRLELQFGRQSQFSFFVPALSTPVRQAKASA